MGNVVSGAVVYLPSHTLQGWVEAGRWADHLSPRVSVGLGKFLEGPMRYLAQIKGRGAQNPPQPNAVNIMQEFPLGCSYLFAVLLVCFFLDVPKVAQRGNHPTNVLQLV